VTGLPQPWRKIDRSLVFCRRHAASAGIATARRASISPLPGRIRGIFSGSYDPAVAGRLRWGASPELELSGVSAAGISGRNGYLRHQQLRQM
jgi:hypothetical protein